MVRKIILSILLFICIGTLFAENLSTGYRQVCSVNDQWEFCYLEKEKSFDYVEQQSWRKINLPHTWNVNEQINDTSAYNRGIGWYRKNLYLSDTYKGKQLYLHFEGANQIAELIVNGKLVGKHIGGYTAFTFDITNYVNIGKGGECNQIVVKVDNRFNKNVPPLSADFTFYGGIYRDVWLISTDMIHFSMNDFGSKGVSISTYNVSDNEGCLKVAGSVDSHLRSDTKLVVKNTILDDQNRIVSQAQTKLKVKANGSSNFVTRPIVIEKPHLWSPDNPCLYKVISEIYCDGKIVDKLNNSFGFRYFSFDSKKGFFLNGKHLKLIGTNRHQDHEGLGNAMPDPLQVRDVEMIKEAGFNFLRLAHYPQDPAVLNAADRLGLLLWEEIPVVNYVTESDEFLTNSKNMLREMIKQNYNHPSIVFWGYMNEVFLHDANGNRGDKMVYPRQYLEWTRYLSHELNNLAHQLDSSRLTVIATHHSDMYDKNGISQIPDVVGYNLYHGWYSSRFSDFGYFVDGVHTQYPERRIVISEYGAGSDKQLHSKSPERFDFSTEYQQEFHEEFLKQIIERPFIGASAVWCQFDFGSNSRGDSKPRINQKGLQYFNRVPKDIYYFYKAVLNPQPVIRIASHDWTTRIISDDGNKDIHTIKIYSNLSELKILVDGKYNRTIKVGDNNIAYFYFQPTKSNHLIHVRSEIDEKVIMDSVNINFYNSIINSKGRAVVQNNLAVNIGAPLEYTDKRGCLWVPDKSYTNKGYGHNNNNSQKQKFTKAILGSENDPLFQFYREGIDSYHFDVEKGEYEVEILLAEVKSIKPGERIMNIYINKEIVWSDLDMASQYGLQRAISKKFKVVVNNTNGIDIDLKAKRGTTILNGLRVSKIKN